MTGKEALERWHLRAQRPRGVVIKGTVMLDDNDVVIRQTVRGPRGGLRKVAMAFSLGEWDALAYIVRLSREARGVDDLRVGDREEGERAAGPA